MNRNILVVIMLLLVVVLGSCMPAYDGVTVNDKDATVATYLNVIVREYNLQDGTLCAIAVSGGGGLAMSCDW